MPNKFFPYYFLLLLFILPLSAFSLPTDKDQPANISANSADLNQKTGINVFKGNVIISQGSTKITANELTTYSDSKHQIIKAIATGTPANYQTLPKKGDHLFQASANTIEYMPTKHQVILMNNGKLEQNDNILQSDYIVYNELTQQLTTKQYNNHRTTIILQPQN